MALPALFATLDDGDDMAAQRLVLLSRLVLWPVPERSYGDSPRGTRTEISYWDCLSRGTGALAPRTARSEPRTAGTVGQFNLLG
eukprot:2183200-Rhodomonas_salina.1